MSTVDKVALSTKLAAYNEYVKGAGKVSQAELAEKYEISPRTLRRWFEVAEAETNTTRPTAQASGKVVTKTKPTKNKKSTAKKTPKSTKPKQTKPVVEVVKTQPALVVPPTIEPEVVAPVVEVIAPVVEEVKAQPVVDDFSEALSYTYVMTARSVSMTKIVNGRVDDTVSIDKTNEVFKDIVDIIMESDDDIKQLERAYMLCRPRTMVEVLSEGRVLIDLKKDKVYYVPEPETEPDVKIVVDSNLATRILSMIHKDGPDSVKSLVMFLDKLLANPSYRAVKELWKFLSHNDIEIAPDGDFFAFKVVTSDFMDKHTRTMSNAVGTVVKMPRNLVDENSANTCSAGLHVCARHYIKSFSSGGDKLVRVKVSPTDVVSIPNDYADSKMRCCRYVVYDLAK